MTTGGTFGSKMPLFKSAQDILGRSQGDRTMVFKPQTFHEVPPQTEIDNPTQAGLEARVAEALARTGAADASQVEVTLEGSVVTLTGTVGTLPEVETVAEVAARVPGVGSVDNRVEALGAGLH
jgi:hypothetical protein